MLIQIPTPTTQGYINFGDTLIFLASIILGPVPGLLAGGAGSALADVLLGYTHYAPWTLIIKGLEGGLVGLLAHRYWLRPDHPIVFIASMIAGGVLMILGYLLVEFVIFGWPVALANIPSNAIQAGGSVIMATVLLLPLRASLPSNTTH
jgi:uncharacterized membrane protein